MSQGKLKLDPMDQILLNAGLIQNGQAQQFFSSEVAEFRFLCSVPARSFEKYSSGFPKPGGVYPALRQTAMVWQCRTGHRRGAARRAAGKVLGSPGNGRPGARGGAVGCEICRRKSQMDIIRAVYDYFKSCPLLDGEGRVRVNFLGDRPVEYVIEEIPAEPIVKRYVDGSSIRQFRFLSAAGRDTRKMRCRICWHLIFMKICQNGWNSRRGWGIFRS